jgi:hypothetical protein
MQTVSKQRFGEHANNNKGIVGNGVLYLVPSNGYKEEFS